eukprot:CAMPEP_0116101092 /NCGR_PEP_ID=MMETSP0327-20121206/12629_1 /TAXON_ID=44447 /ORGANISM="Pseudo-nitzschia delicatissima, Strain B596" /LENGTH=808 /DNA_ID=CAMNT_0003593037 /DNA_START=105 /DNA_END=2531 /DNA_ORIENTATION=+
MRSYFNDVPTEQNADERNSNNIARDASASHTSPSKKGSLPLSSKNDAFHHHPLPYHSRNNSDSNSSMEDSHDRRVALMMSSPGRPPRSNSSRDKQRRRTRPLNRRTGSGSSGGLSQPLLSDGYSESAESPVATRRRPSNSLPGTVSPSHRRRFSAEKSRPSEYSSTESESSTDTSPSPSKGQQQSSPRLSISGKRRQSRSSNDSTSSFTDSYDPKCPTKKSPTKYVPSPRDRRKSAKTKPTTSNKCCSLSGVFFGIVLMSLFGMILLTRRAVPAASRVDEDLFNAPTESGLRRNHVLGGVVDTISQDILRSKERKKSTENANNGEDSLLSSSRLETKKTSKRGTTMLPHQLQIHTPPSVTSKSRTKFENVDRNMYYPSKLSREQKKKNSYPRTVILDPTVKRVKRKIDDYPADFSDNTQLYGILSSDDERLNKMEMREPYSKNECVPMQEWQTAYQPSCNGIHELALQTLGASVGANDEKHTKNRKAGAVEGLDATLFGTKGFWRYAWKLVIGHHDYRNAEKDTIVFKNLKYQHNFEDAHFEHDRVDAVAMERLTSSPHVINIFGFCGHSVMTEYAGGKRVGQLADKAKKVPLKRLEIALDIANGLADVHGIDGDGNTTFVHLDVNPANVVSVNGTLKLNDFNIGIIRQWNTTSNEPCGFPAQYPNPQWRSPEEARNEQHLTEKVDVFSLGHIFFRLICGHEPWNKLEPGGKPSKAEIDEKVQRGDLPFIPDHVLNSDDPEVVAIREVMLKCYTFDPKERPSARYIANVLERVYKNLKHNYSRNPPKEKKKEKKKAKAKSSTTLESSK